MTSRSDALMTTVLLFIYYLHFKDAGPEDIGLVASSFPSLWSNNMAKAF